MATRRKTPVKRRRRRTSSLGRVTKAAVMNQVKESAQAAIGGAVFGFVSNLIPATWGNTGVKAAQAGAIILTGTMLKQKGVAAGMAGVFGAQLASDFGLADNYATGQNYLPSSDALSDGMEYPLLSDGVYPQYSQQYF